MTNIDSTKPYTHPQTVQKCLTLIHKSVLKKEKQKHYTVTCAKTNSYVLIFKYHWYRLNQIIILFFQESMT